MVKANHKKLKDAKGQMVIETMLLMVVFLGLTLFVASEFKSRQLVSQLVSGPWQKLDGMISNGAWEPRSSSDIRHPSRHQYTSSQFRHRAMKGIKAQ